MQASTSRTPPKPWESSVRRSSVVTAPGTSSLTAPGTSSSSATSTTAAATSAANAATASSSSGVASSSRVLSASPTSSSSYGSTYGSAYGSGYSGTSMLGSSMYGGSMYGGMYGSSGYGSSMYSGYGGYGGYGSSMYGGMGSGGMYGRQTSQGSEWFAPKVPKGQEEPTEVSKPLHELTELNTSFLESVSTYGDNIYNFARRLIKGLAKLHVAVLTGSLHPRVARQLALVAIAAFAAVAAAVIRARRRTPSRTSPFPWEARELLRHRQLPHASLTLGHASAL